MRNRTICILSIFLLSIICLSCKNELTLERKMINYEEHKHKRWKHTIDSTLEGNFTDSGYREILVFFNLVLKNDTVKLNESKLFIVDKNEKILSEYDLFYYNYIVDDRNFIKEIDKFDIAFNNAVITDFNKNGKLELIYFAGEGSVFTFYIEEFKNGKFQHICQTYDGELNIPGLYNFDLTHFDFETKSLYLSDRESPEKIKLTWNPETEFYEKEILQK